MDKIIEELKKHTEGMLYISESDSELDVQDWGKLDKAGVLKKINARGALTEELETTTFFKRTIDALDPSDELGAELAEQYKKLEQYLQNTFAQLFVFRNGEMTIDIYIVCITKDDDCFAIHTISVET